MRSELGTCALLLLAVGLVFGQTIRHDFISLDDPVCVYLNRNVTGGLTAADVKWAFTHWCDGTYTPAALVSHMLDCQFHGVDAGWHHLTNVLLHAATVVLLFLVLRRMTGRQWPSALAAALFAVHPLRVESVAWVVERKDVLSGLFFVLTLAAYLRLVRRGFSLARYLIVLVCFLLGLLAKPALVTLPLVLLLSDYWPLGRMTKPRPSVAPSPARSPIAPSAAASFSAATNARSPIAALWNARSPIAALWRLVLEKIPLLALSIVFCAVTIGSTRGGQGVNDPHDRRFDPAWRAENVPISYVGYLGTFFYPAGLALPYPRAGLDVPPWKVFGAVLLLLVLTAAALIGWRRRPYLPVGWLWYVFMLAPMSGLLLFDMHATATTADRFTYLPEIGLGIALSWGLADALRSPPFRRWAGSVAAALAVAVLMGAAWRQTSFWRDNETLWEHAIACTANNKMARHALGKAFLDQGRVWEAVAQFRAAIAIEPDYAMPHYDLGVALAGVGRLDEAMGQYEQAVRLDPENAAAQNNLGQALLFRGRLDEGVAHCRAALKIDPELAEAHYNVGSVLDIRGRIDEAIKEYRKALGANPELVEAHYHLGMALARRGQLVEASAEYRKAAEACHHLGMAFARRGQLDAAIDEYRLATQIDPSYEDARRDLGRALEVRKNSNGGGGERPSDYGPALPGKP
jgi:tetratricopeptide (TPR) repeat protein